MFENRKKTYTLEKLVTNKNSYNEEIQSYELVGNIKMFISLSTNEIFSSADMRINQCSHIGLTKYPYIEKGMRVNGKYQVEFVNGTGIENIVYMKEIENNGTFI